MEIVKRDVAKEINFQGMMVGNPYVDPFSNTITQIQAFYQHGLLAKPLFDQWSVQCTDPKNYDSDVSSCQFVGVSIYKLKSPHNKCSIRCCRSNVKPWK